MKRGEALRQVATALWVLCIGVAVATNATLLYVFSLVGWVPLLVWGIKSGPGIHWPSKNPDDYLRRR